MRGEGFAMENLSFTLEFGIRGTNGLQWIESPFTYLEQEEQARKLADRYVVQSGTDSAELVIERISLRAECVTPHYRLPVSSAQGSDPEKASKGVREVFWGTGYVKTNIYERELLQCGNRIEGPAIVEAPDTTYVIPPGWSYTVDKYLNGIMEASRNEG